jgi:hypothetical protein
MVVNWDWLTDAVTPTPKMLTPWLLSCEAMSIDALNELESNVLPLIMICCGGSANDGW